MTAHLFIEGQVQGVFYRASAKDVADELNIKGWIRNLPDGNVETLAIGDEAAIKEFIAWCKKGPKKAVVTNVTVKTEMADAEQYEKFQIIRG